MLTISDQKVFMKNGLNEHLHINYYKERVPIYKGVCDTSYRSQFRQK